MVQSTVGLGFFGFDFEGDSNWASALNNPIPKQQLNMTGKNLL